jgi:hypothetical protein
MRTEGQTQSRTDAESDRRDEANSHVSQVCKHAEKVQDTTSLLMNCVFLIKKYSGFVSLKSEVLPITVSLYRNIVFIVLLPLAQQCKNPGSAVQVLMPI